MFMNRFMNSNMSVKYLIGIICHKTNYCLYYFYNFFPKVLLAWCSVVCLGFCYVTYANIDHA